MLLLLLLLLHTVNQHPMTPFNQTTPQWTLCSCLLGSWRG
jgi:uncharacterized membrane protein YdcZ (DUF606 family)